MGFDSISENNRKPTSLFFGSTLVFHTSQQPTATLSSSWFWLISPPYHVHVLNSERWSFILHNISASSLSIGIQKQQGSSTGKKNNKTSSILWPLYLLQSSINSSAFKAKGHALFLVPSCSRLLCTQEPIDFFGRKPSERGDWKEYRSSKDGCIFCKVVISYTRKDLSVCRLLFFVNWVIQPFVGFNKKKKKVSKCVFDCYWWIYGTLAKSCTLASLSLPR
jgi:hypothetical protein